MLPRVASGGRGLSGFASALMIPAGTRFPENSTIIEFPLPSAHLAFGGGCRVSLQCGTICLRLSLNEVHNIWLEFDINGPPSNVPQPSFFLGTNFLRPELDCDWLLDFALPVLNQEYLQPDAKALLRHCIQSLPNGAQIFQLGRMLARSSTATRLCARGIPTTELLPYLHNVGWEGAAADMAAQIESLSRHAERIDLDFDVDTTVLPKLGFECLSSP